MHKGVVVGLRIWMSDLVVHETAADLEMGEKDSRWKLEEFWGWVLRNAGRGGEKEGIRMRKRPHHHGVRCTVSKGMSSTVHLSFSLLGKRLVLESYARTSHLSFHVPLWDWSFPCSPSLIYVEIGITSLVSQYQNHTSFIYLCITLTLFKNNFQGFSDINNIN